MALSMPEQHTLIYTSNLAVLSTTHHPVHAKKTVILSHTSNFSTTAAGPHWKKRFDALTMVKDSVYTGEVGQGQCAHVLGDVGLSRLISFQVCLLVGCDWLWKDTTRFKTRNRYAAHGDTFCNLCGATSEIPIPSIIYICPTLQADRQCLMKDALPLSHQLSMSSSCTLYSLWRPFSVLTG